MGDRFILEVACPSCGTEDDDVYFAPTCGVTEWVCPKCGCRVDMCDYTGISYEDASNLGTIESIVEEVVKGEKHDSAMG